MFCSCRICTDKRVVSPSAIAELLVVYTTVDLEKLIHSISELQSTIAPTTHYCLSHLRRSGPPILRLRPKLHRFDLSRYLLHYWLYNI